MKKLKRRPPEEWVTLSTNKTEFIVQVTAPNGQDLGTIDFNKNELVSLLRWFGWNDHLKKGMRLESLENSFYATQQRHRDLGASYRKQNKQLYPLIEAIEKSTEQVDRYEQFAKEEAHDNWLRKQKEELELELEERERLEAEELLEEEN